MSWKSVISLVLGLWVSAFGSMFIMISAMKSALPVSGFVWAIVALNAISGCYVTTRAVMSERP